MCINTEDPTLVIITPPHLLRGKNFGELKFGDQASIHQICQNLLPPIFSAILYVARTLVNSDDQLVYMLITIDTQVLVC